MSENTITRPAERDTKAAWVQYAVDSGMDGSEAEALTKDALMALDFTPATDGEQGQQDGEQGQQDGDTPTTGEAPTPTPATPAKAARAKAPDTSGITAEGIKSAVLAMDVLLSASEPERARKDEQKLMDDVVANAYKRWVEAGRPTLWQKMPVGTYFLTEDELRPYKYLITQAAKIVKPEPDEKGEVAPGVTIRFGNEFTLTEEVAQRIEGHEQDAGKTVLAFAAIDKQKRNPKSPATQAAENRAEREANE